MALKKMNKTEYNRQWNFYCLVLKTGRAFYGNKPGALARAYRELGKFHEISEAHLTAMYNHWKVAVN